jgi:hypothetical protein
VSGNAITDDFKNVTLKRLVDAFGSTFVNRLHAKSQEYLYDGKPIDRSQTGLVSTIHTAFSEFEVMMRYLRQTGIQDFLDGDQQLVRFFLLYIERIIAKPWVLRNKSWWDSIGKHKLFIQR